MLWKGHELFWPLKFTFGLSMDDFEQLALIILGKEKVFGPPGGFLCSSSSMTITWKLSDSFILANASLMTPEALADVVIIADALAAVSCLATSPAV